MGSQPGRRHAPILIVVALAVLLSVPVASAQLGTSVRINSDTGTGTGPDAELSTDLDAGDTSAELTDGATRILDRPGAATSTPTPSIRLHTRINADTIGSLVTQSLEAPEVRKLLGGRAVLDVAVDSAHYRVDIQDGNVLSVTATDSVTDADYIIRAGTDAARSLANAAEPAFTAVTLLKGHYLTVEAAKLTHQAALKAFFSGFLDSQLNVQSRLQDVVIDKPTAAQQAILDAGLRIVKHGDHLFAANDLGGLVAALHNGNPALGNPPPELGIRLSGIAGGATMDTTQLTDLVAANAAANAAIRGVMAGTHTTQDAELGLDTARVDDLSGSGAPDAFLAGLGASHLAKGALAGADA